MAEPVVNSSHSGRKPAPSEVTLTHRECLLGPATSLSKNLMREVLFFLTLQMGDRDTERLRDWLKVTQPEEAEQGFEPSRRDSEAVL